MSQLPPEVLIPTGPYCYQALGLSYGDDGMPSLSTRLCVFYERVESGARCRHLGVEHDVLLDDACKICGINEPDEL